MFDRLSNGWELAQESWLVLKQDKELLIFPAVSGVCCLLVLASFILPLWGLGFLDPVLAGGANANEAAQNPMTWVVTFFYYWANYFVIIFFNSALVGCAVIRFKGGDPTVSDGFRIAGSRLPQILGWSFLSATVGLVLKMVESKSKGIGQIVAGLMGAAWSIATYFAVPVMVIEKTGPIESFKRSVSIMKQTWGEALGANFGIGFIMFLASIPGIALIFLGAFLAGTTSFALGIAVIAMGVLWTLATSLIGTALDAIIVAALYLYAAEGQSPSLFNQGLLRGAFVEKRE